MKRNLWTLAMLAFFSYSCDEMGNDVIPPDDEIEANQAANITAAIPVFGPIVIDLVQDLQLTEDATISIVKPPQKGQIRISEDGLMLYQPNGPLPGGTDNATYSVCNGGNCDEGNIEFRYSTPENCMVSCVYDVEVPLVQGGVAWIDVLKNDINCEERFDVSTLKIVKAPSRGQARVSDGLIVYTPPPNTPYISQLLTYGVATHENPDHFYYGVAKFTPIYQAFEAKDDHLSYSIWEFRETIRESGGKIDYSLEDILGNDTLHGIPYNQLQISIIEQPAHGEATYYPLEMFRYRPADNFAGEDQFTYQVCYNGDCLQATVTISVTGWVKPVYVAVTDRFEYTRAQFEALTGSGYHSLDLQYSEIIGNDRFFEVDPKDVTLQLTFQPAHGTVTYYSRELFRYVPNENFTGRDSFVYMLCRNGRCDVDAVVEIIVTDW